MEIEQSAKSQDGRMTYAEDLITRLDAANVGQSIAMSNLLNEAKAAVSAMANVIVEMKAASEEAEDRMGELEQEIDEWKQAAEVESGLRDEFLARAEAAEALLEELNG